MAKTAKGSSPKLQEDVRLAKLGIIDTLFDVSRYANVPSLSLVDWSNSLQRRRWFDLWAEDASIEDLSFACALLHLARFPIGRYAEHLPLEPGYRAVSTLTIHEAWLIRDAIDEQPRLRDALRAADEQLSERDFHSVTSSAWDQKTKEAMQRPAHALLHHGAERWVNVDLSAPDHVLLSDFQNWLAEQRQHQACKQARPPIRFTAADMMQWSRSRVLPYLDLLLLAKAFKVRIKQHEIAERLFPDERAVDVVERVRKVTKPLAEQLRDRITLAALVRTARGLTPEEVERLKSSGDYVFIPPPLDPT